MTEEIWLLEQDVAKKIGVSRAIVTEYRKAHLQRDQDWRVTHKQVELSQDAIDKISTALGASTALAHNTAPPQAVELTVARIWPNPRLIEANTADGQAIRVWVPKNKNFRPGMKIKARPPDNGSFQYTLEGRCPRYPGRW